MGLAEIREGVGVYSSIQWLPVLTCQWGSTHNKQDSSADWLWLTFLLWLVASFKHLYCTFLTMRVSSTHPAQSMIWGLQKQGRWLKHALIQCGSSVVLALHTFHLDCTLRNYISSFNKTCDVLIYSFFFSPNTRVFVTLWPSPFYLWVTRWRIVFLRISYLCKCVVLSLPVPFDVVVLPFVFTFQCSSSCGHLVVHPKPV